MNDLSELTSVYAKYTADKLEISLDGNASPTNILTFLTGLD
jgi:hypothetical protein